MSYLHPLIQDANTVLGFFGFGITIFVMLQVGAIKKSFKSKALLPEIIKDIENKGSILNRSINDWPNSKVEIKSTIKDVDSLLSTSLKFAINPEKSELKKIKKKIKSAILKFDSESYKSVEAIWDIYSDIQGALILLRHNSKNLDWN